MNKTVSKLRRTDVTYLIAATSCSLLLYGGYRWYAKESPDQAPTTVSSQLQSANLIYQEGIALYKEGKYNEAIAKHQQALNLYPQHAGAYTNISLALLRLGQNDQAIEQAQKAIEVNPQYSPAYLLLGQLSQMINKTDAAKNYYQQALKVDANFWEAHLFLAGIYVQEATVDSCKKALTHITELLKLQPQNLDAHMLLGDIYLILGRPLDARKEFQLVQDKNPQSPAALVALGKTFEHDHDFKQAIDYYQKAVGLKSDYPQAHVAIAGCHFALGHLEQGFKEYEWRWQLSNMPNLAGKWDGASLKDKRIMVLSENGLGDILQYVRFVQLLKQQGAHVILNTPKALVPLFKQLNYVNEVIEAGTEQTQYDVVTSMQSIPYITKVTEKNLINKPYVQADAKLVDEWRVKLGSDKHFKVGMIWQPGDDSYLALNQKHTIGLNIFAPLAQNKKLSFYSLQKGTDIEKQLAATPQGFKVNSFGEDFDTTHGAFMDTAAIMKNLDLVITADTSVAHLAGALGVKTWILLPYVSDTRWIEGRNDSPWYPSMRVFKQEKAGDWESVMKQVNSELQKLTASK